MNMDVLYGPHKWSQSCICGRCKSLTEVTRLFQETVVEERMEGDYVKEDTDLKNKFIVWNPESNKPPRVVYGTKGNAVKVAMSMATRNPGERFAICKVVGVGRSVKTTYESYEG